MNEALRPERKESTERQLSEQEIVRLLYLSYMLSQGDPMMQDVILKSARVYYGQQHNLDTENIASIFGKTIATSENELRLASSNKHRKVSSPYVRKEIINVSQGDPVNNRTGYLEILTKPDILLTEEDYFTVAQSTWFKDNYFLLKTNGRPNKESGAPASINAKSAEFMEDPFFSYGVHFLIRENDTGTPAYNELFRLAAKTTIVTEDKDFIRKIVSKYNETHPDSKVTEEELSRVVQIDNDAQST